MKALIEGEDYYPDKTGLFVFTEKYLLQRGTCCGNARPNGSSGRAFADNIVVALWQSSDMFYLAGKNKH